MTSERRLSRRIGSEINWLGDHRPFRSQGFASVSKITVVAFCTLDTVDPPGPHLFQFTSSLLTLPSPWISFDSSLAPKISFVLIKYSF